MEIGQLNERIKLYSRSTVLDAHGQATITWVLQNTVWARHFPMPASERFAAAQTQGVVPVRFHIRKGPAVDETWRMEWQSKGYDITGVTQFGRTHLELIAQEGVKDGR